MIKEIQDFRSFISTHPTLENCTIQHLDFREETVDWANIIVGNTNFLGCQFRDQDRMLILKHGGRIYEADESLPYQPFRSTLYRWQELLDRDPEREQTTDECIYRHFEKSRFNPDINEALWQRIHDHAIDDALREHIQMDDQGMPRPKCVGIMGGHSMGRDAPAFLSVALLAQMLAKAGYLVVSGGGPGIMEAANLGAFFANESSTRLHEAVAKLSRAPHYQETEYHRTAHDIYQSVAQKAPSLAIPTWFYGHEPTNLFASHIAKYFSNSIREDTLLAICLHGVIFAPGSAGTLQEVFMDLAQNYYKTHGWYSPMIFFNGTFFQELGVSNLIDSFLQNHPFRNFVFTSDSTKEVLDFLKSHPPNRGE